MRKNHRLATLFLCFFQFFYAQVVEIPVDFRQHNLTKYNTNLLNPVFSFVGNEKSNLTTWGRIQWTELDVLPTTYFTNYSGRVGENNGIGLGVFQHDTGIFTNIGIVGNYARVFKIGRNSMITVGLNLIASKRNIDPNDFTFEEFNLLPDEGRNDFILTAMPGVNLTLGDFNLGVASENFFDYNFSESGQETSFDDKIFLGHASYEFHFGTSSGTILEYGSLKAFSYVKVIPDFETQFGGNLLLNIKNGWMQAGYNSFYGPSIGLGAKLFNTFGIGGLIELENMGEEFNLGPTYEFVFSWEFGYESDRSTSFAGPVKKKKRKRKRIKEESISTIKEKSIEKVAIQTLPLVAKDTIPEDTYAKFFNPEEKNDRYFVVERIEGVEYGFYLVVNVYATEKYFNLFFEELKSKGLNPKYFFNKENNYYYVYLQKYDSLKEIEAARASNYNGNYLEDTWIMWIQRSK